MTSPNPPSRAAITILADCPLALVLAARLRGSRAELTTRWLDRIVARVSLDPNRIFPTDELLDHVPILLDGVAAYIEDPASVLRADMTVIDKARELGALRHAQGFDAFEILKEFDLLGNILLTFLSDVVEESDERCTPRELFACAQRVFQAVHMLQEATTTQFLQLLAGQVAEREDKLRAFHRALTHEFRNRIGASLGAAQVLEIPDLPDTRRDELVAVIARNAASMRDALEGLLELARSESDPRQQRHVRLPAAAAEARRLLRDMAHSRKVTVSVASDMPGVEVNAAAVELCLNNLISNAIKYAATSAQPLVEVRARLGTPPDSDAEAVIVEVADNGPGVPAGERDKLFERFFRSSVAVSSGAEGTGLGLSIVRETVEALGGRTWAEFPATGGSVFAFTLPFRRQADHTAPGAERA